MSNHELVSKIQSAFLRENIVDYRTGMEVEVYQVISE